MPLHALRPKGFGGFKTSPKMQVWNQAGHAGLKNAWLIASPPKPSMWFSESQKRRGLRFLVTCQALPSRRAGVRGGQVGVPTPPPPPSFWTARQPDVTVPSKASPRHLRGPWAGVGPTSHFLQAPPRVRRQAPGGGRPDVTFPSEAPWARSPRKDFLPQALARARGRRRSARSKKSLPQWGCKFENALSSMEFSI